MPENDNAHSDTPRRPRVVIEYIDIERKRDRPLEVTSRLHDLSIVQCYKGNKNDFNLPARQYELDDDPPSRPHRKMGIIW